MKKYSQFTIFIVTLILLFVNKINAQTKNVKVFSLGDCIEFALNNNENIKSENLNISYQKQYKKSATEIPKTTMTFTQGQFNSVYRFDNNFAFSQQIPFPSVFASHNAVATAQIKGSEYKLEATKADLIYQIKTSYYSLLYSKAIHKLFQKEDSIYDEFMRIVSDKYLKNEATLLEKTAAEMQVIEIHNKLLEKEDDIHNYQIQLQTLMHIKEDFVIENQNIAENYLTVRIDSTAIAEHPYLKYLEQRIEVDRKIVGLETSKIMPDFTLGYFNQSIYGPANIGRNDMYHKTDYDANNYFLTTRNRLQGFQVGLAVPLWFHPQKSKIKAAKINTEFAQSDYNYNTSVFEGQFKQAVNQYLKYQKSLSFYKTNALTNSKLIIEQALKSYNLKEINYVEYLQVVSHALTIENNFLSVIHQNNLAVIKVEYLLAK